MVYEHLRTAHCNEELLFDEVFPEISPFSPNFIKTNLKSISCKFIFLSF